MMKGKEKRIEKLKIVKVMIVEIEDEIEINMKRMEWNGGKKVMLGDEKERIGIVMKESIKKIM